MRILLVDDDLNCREVIQTFLTHEGFEVQAVENGLLALVALESVAPDVVLLDLMMPIMSGWEFLKHKNRTPSRGIPVVVMSALREPVPEADVVLEKPCNLDKLLFTLRHIVGASQGEQP